LEIISGNPQNSSVSPPRVVMCLCALKEEAYIDEWLEHYFLLGFDLIHIYDNGREKSEYISKLPARYNRLGDGVSDAGKGKIVVEHRPHNKRGGVQKEMYQDCAKKYSDRQNTWVVYFDVDEYLVLRKEYNIKDFIASVMDKKICKRGICGAISISRVTFGSNGHQQWSNKSVVERFTARHPNAHASVKTMMLAVDFVPIRPPYTIHAPSIREGKVRVDAHGTVLKATHHGHPHEDTAALYHYFTKSYNEFKSKRARGRVTIKHSERNFSDTSELKSLNKEFKAYDEKCTVQDTSAILFRNKLRSLAESLPVDSNSTNHLHS